MIVEVLSLMGKGLVGILIVGVFLTFMLALWHLQNYIRRNHPRIHAWGGHITVLFVVVAVITIVLMIAGVVVETFFWR